VCAFEQHQFFLPKLLQETVFCPKMSVGVGGGGLVGTPEL
jgi:hypothetical protein